MEKGSKSKWILICSLLAAGLILTVLLPLIIRAYVVQAYKVPAGSMKPTLLIGDHILVDKLPKKLVKIEREDIVVFIYPIDPGKDFVKRVVGLPNDLIEIRDKELYVNGSLFNEDYVIHTDPKMIPADIRPRDYFGPIKVPINSIFVLGDNRDASFDSRFWGFLT